MIDENVSVFKCPKCGKTTGGNEKFCIEWRAGIGYHLPGMQ